MLLKAYSDDSRGGDPPVAILAGWVAPAEVWLDFIPMWDDILRMSPRIRYFKFSEAINYNGEFLGISEERRNEKIILLVNLISEFKLLGLVSAAPLDLFYKYFGNLRDGTFKRPYPLLFVRIISRLHAYYINKGEDLPRIDFIFDRQVEEEEDASLGWREFVRFAPEELKPMIGNPPSFLDDKDAIPLQAADLIAGWFRMQYSAFISGNPLPTPPWGKRGSNLEVLTWTLDEAIAKDIIRLISNE